MDAIRRQQIDEILNYDRNMNLQVLALQRKQVALMGPEGGETGELQKQDVIDTANTSVNSFLVFLDKRSDDVNTITQWHFNGSEKCTGMQ